MMFGIGEECFICFDKTMQKNITITNNDEKEKTAQPVENSQDIDRNEFNTEKNGSAYIILKGVWIWKLQIKIT